MTFEWQPIETAPRGTVPLLLWAKRKGDPTFRQVCGWRYSGMWAIYGCGKSQDCLDTIEPTHWRYQDAPPHIPKPDPLVEIERLRIEAEAQDNSDGLRELFLPGGWDQKIWMRFVEQAIRRGLEGQTDALKIPAAALDALRNGQQQIDEDGVMIAVSRQALYEVLEALKDTQTDALKICPECNGELERNEDLHGISYQCTSHGCFSLFGQEEIENIKETT